MPDKRTTQGKQWYAEQQHSAPKASISTVSSVSSYGASSAPSYVAKKDGTPDMRYNASKAYVASYSGGSSSSYSAPSYSAPSYSVPSYSAPSYSAPSYSAPSVSSGGSLAGYTGRVTAAGLPDMRTNAGKAWAAANK